MYMDRGMVQRGIETVRRQRALRTSCDRAALSRWRVRLRALLARMQACEHRRGSVYRQHLLQQRDFWWWSTSARACARRLELDSHAELRACYTHRLSIRGCTTACGRSGSEDVLHTDQLTDQLWHNILRSPCAPHVDSGLLPACRDVSWTGEGWLGALGWRWVA